VEITWQGVVELVDEHPAIAAGRHQVAAAHAAIDAAGAVPNPSVEATAAYGRAIDDSASRLEWGLSLSIPLGWIAGRGSRLDAAQEEARAIESDSDALRRGVILQLRALFWGLVYEQDRVLALTQLSAESSALARSVASRVEHGEARPVEATRLEVEAATIEAELEVARAALAAQRARLAVWLGGLPDRTLVADADLTDLPQPLSAKQVMDKIDADHPSLSAARARARALEAGVTAARRERVPAVELEIFTDHELDRRAYGVGLSFDLPIWNWNSGSIHRSEAEAAAARTRLEALRTELEAAAIDYQSKCQAGVTLARRYLERILPRARAAVQLVERTHQLGEASVLEVIDARRTLLETRRNFLRAMVRAQTDCGELSALIGEESR
jgi:cobalt-zinc-cadmium efflux system outer membrane protein